MFYTLLISACSSKDTKKETISFNADSSKILIDLKVPEAVAYVQNLLLKDSVNLGLIEVLETKLEADSISRETPLSGSVKLNGNFLEFSPSTPFVKGNLYVVNTYVGQAIGDTKAALRGGLNLRGKPQIKTLER